MVEKPAGYIYVPGQATDVSINRDGLKDELRPFTFTSLTDADHLEFTIKIYTGHNGITEKLGSLSAGDELILHEVFGAIEYKGPGVFIAGGAGITPFLAILRDLHRQGKLDGNILLFANHTNSDIILKEELTEMLGNNLINVIAEQGKHIDKAMLRDYVKEGRKYYICGPDEFVNTMQDYLHELGVKQDDIVIEQ